MSLIFLLAGLTSTMTLASNDITPGKVTVGYDEFKNKTTISVMGQQVKGQPVLHLSDSFPGRKPGPHPLIQIGFLTPAPNMCPFPNFLADGKRVEPEPSAIGINPTVVTSLPGDERQVYTFVFNFYKPQQAAQIAKAKTVEYKICDEVFTLAPQDQKYMRHVLSYYNAEESNTKRDKK